jgi:hypothetical protein
VRAVRDWIDLSYLTEGPLFRPINRYGKILPSRLTGQSVALIVKRWALQAGFDPALFAGHSLRSGLATAAAKAGKSERSIMKQTGHRSVTRRAPLHPRCRALRRQRRGGHLPLMGRTSSRLPTVLSRNVMRGAAAGELSAHTSPPKQAVSTSPAHHGCPYPRKPAMDQSKEKQWLQQRS